MTPVEAAEKVYERLIAQGRPEPDARRDAEAWVQGNLGVAVQLPAPEPVAHPPVAHDVIIPWAPGVYHVRGGGTITIHFGSMSNSTTTATW